MYTLMLNNFRNFQNSELNFKKVNILIGENSSGKSSILKFLLALKQSIDKPRESNLLLNGKLVDLGNYKSVIYKNDIKNKLEFSFKFQSDINPYIRNDITKLCKNLYGQSKSIDKLIKKYCPSSGHYSIKFQLSNNLDDPYAVRTTITHPSLGYIKINRKKERNQYNIRYGNCWIKYKSITKDYPLNTIKNLEYEYNSFLSLILPLSLEEQLRSNYGKKHIDEFIKIGCFLLVQNRLYEFIDKFIYVNPILSKPSRFFYKKDPKSTYSNNDIEKLIHFLSDIKISDSLRIKISSQLKKALKISQIADDVKITNPKDFPVLELKIKTQGKWRNISDVGYGVSLQLPILFESILADLRGGKTLLIEQPEVHLHPKLQSSFIEALVTVSPRNIFIIETHSEHIVRKIQLLVKKKILSPSDISIYYLRNGKTKFFESLHDIDENGLLKTPFPEGFYDQSYTLTEELFDL